MAFTRKFLSSLGIEEDKVDSIIEAHSEVVDALKSEISKYKADAEKLPDVQKQLDDMKNGTGNEYKEKYDTLKKEYDDYKAGVDEQRATAAKTDAYKAILKEVGISDKRIGTVVRVDTDVIKGIELDDKGNVKNADDLKEKAKNSWEDFIVNQNTQGTDTATPPTGSGKVYKTKEEIMAIEDDDERQLAIAENHEMFGF